MQKSDLQPGDIVWVINGTMSFKVIVQKNHYNNYKHQYTGLTSWDGKLIYFSEDYSGKYYGDYANEI